MAHTDINQGRRRLLITATSVVGAAGVAAVAAPFLNSWNPSARALAAGAPIEVDISKVEPGQLLRVIWRGKPVWIINRSQEMLDQVLFGRTGIDRRFLRHQHRVRPRAEVGQRLFGKRRARPVLAEFLARLAVRLDAFRVVMAQHLRPADD